MSFDDNQLDALLDGEEIKRPSQDFPISARTAGYVLALTGAKLWGGVSEADLQELKDGLRGAELQDRIAQNIREHSDIPTHTTHDLAWK